MREFMVRCPSCGVSLASDEDTTSDPPRRHRPSWRWLAVLAGAALVAAVVVWVTSDHRASTTSPQPPAARAGKPNTTSPPALPPPLATPPVKTGAAVVGLVGTTELAVLSVDDHTVRVVPIPGADPGATQTNLFAVGSNAIVFSGYVTGGQVWSFGASALRGETSAASLGPGSQVLPDTSGAGERVTIVTTLGFHRYIRGISVDGTNASPLTQVPDGYRVDAIVDGGVVLDGVTPANRPALRVWNPQDGSFVDLGAGGAPVLMAAAGPTIVWRDADDGGHDVHVRDQRSGHDAVVPLVNGVVGYDGDEAVVTPDGARVAFGVNVDPNTFNTAILDVASGAVALLPQDAAAASYLWTPDGAWLFVGQRQFGLFDRAGRQVSTFGDFAAYSRLGDLTAVTSR